MKNLMHTTQTQRTKATMTAVIILPIIFTMAMWVILPSGYRRFNCKKEVRTTITNWQPLQAGLKQVVFSLQ